MKNKYIINFLCVLIICLFIYLIYYQINIKNSIITNKNILIKKYIDILNKKVIRGPNIYTNKKLILLKFNKDNSQFIISEFKNELFKIHSLCDKKLFNKIINTIFIFEFDYNYDNILLKSCDLVLEIINQKYNMTYKEKDFINYYLSISYKIKELQDEYNNNKIGPSTENILNACMKKNIPFIRLNDASLFQLGWGINQKKIEATTTSNTFVISEQICKDKDLTKTILEGYGIPVPKGYLVENENDLLKYFKMLGSSVVLKPYDGNHGNGVFIDINNINSLLKTYKIVSKTSDYIIIEKFIKGFDYRILVIGHKVIAVAKRVPPFVIGDGKKTITQLIDILNSDPKRGDDHQSLLTKIIIDDVVENTLIDYDLNKNSIIPKNKKVWLRKNANLSSGGTGEDVTDIIHKSIINYSEEISKIINLDICGIDLVCEDITKDLDSQNGAFIEVNSGPGLRMHISPNIGKPRNAGLDIINNLFPNNKNGRVPIISVTGVNGKTTTTNLISFILSKKYITGKATTNGLYINQNLIEKCDCSGPISAQKILMNPTIEACVFETARGGILKGLGYDLANVGILTNIGEGDHIGQGFENATIEDLINIKCVVIKNILPNGFVVLNANDKYIEKTMSVIQNHLNTILFSINKDNLLLQKHYSNGNRIIYYDNENIIYSFKKNKNDEIFKLSDIPLLEEKILFQIENVMASIGGCIGINLNIEIIKNGLSKFINNSENNPGRFNLLKYKDSNIIIDYAHNIDSIKHICNYAHEKKNIKKIIMFGAAGDRDNKLIMTMTKMLFDSFDILILFVDKGIERGRTTEQLFELMMSDIKDWKKTNKLVLTVYGENNSIDIGFEYVNNNPNSLFIVLADNVPNTLTYISNKIKN